jgi:hypothetical protein
MVLCVIVYSLFYSHVCSQICIREFRGAGLSLSHSHQLTNVSKTQYYLLVVQHCVKDLMYFDVEINLVMH